MNRLEFIAATAVILFVAFMLGWFCAWLVGKLRRTTRSDMTDLDRLAQELHEAEQARDQALGLLQEREAHLTAELSQTGAELRAAMETLRALRHENERLRGRPS